jgi:hypothetical protein
LVHFFSNPIFFQFYSYSAYPAKVIFVVRTLIAEGVIAFSFSTYNCGLDDR